MIKIWHIYNNPDYIINNDITINFNVDDYLSKPNINYLNKYLNEYVAFYYIWKNQIKSDIIGFSHNNYIFNNVNIDKINEGYIQVYEIYKTPAYNIYEDMNYIGLGYFIHNIIDYFKTNYFKYYNNFIDLLFLDYEVNKYKPIRNTFICEWEIFNNLINFINGFLEKIFNKNIMNLQINDINEFALKLNELQWNYREEYFNFMNVKNYDNCFFGYPRNFAFLIEYLVCIYFMIFYKEKYFVI